MEDSPELISFKEFANLWPKTDDGRTCARLIRRYFYSQMVLSASTGDTSPMGAQATAGASKAHAKFCKDFEGLEVPAAPAPERKPLPTLKRFESPKPAGTPEKK